MISIVTSAYNAESTIGRAIESVQCQSHEDWEMIVVDDCSSDGTAEVVRSYADRDTRIRLVSHEVNKGAGLARRTGISHVRGQFMTFLDSDDYIAPDCLGTLLYHMVSHDVDIVAPGYMSVTPEGKLIHARVPECKVIQVDGAKFRPNKEDTKRFMNPMLIRSSLWDKVEYSSRRFIEDTPTLVQILYWARSVLLLDYAGYYYVQNPSSLIHTASAVKNLIYRSLAIKDNGLFFRSQGLHHLANDGEFRRTYSEVLRLCSSADKARFRDELKELKDYYKTMK